MDLHSERDAERSDAETIRGGDTVRYAQWMGPAMDSNDMQIDRSAADATAADSGRLAAPRRGRGRPRVTKPRDNSAIEKRRAQVREAQRSYQKRKDNFVASEKHRCDDLLQIVSDLSTEVEDLLRAASKAGIIGQPGDVATQMRRLWSVYDGVINNPSVQPELRLLQIKNDRRRADHQSSENFRVVAVRQPETLDQLPCSSSMPIPQEIDLELVRHDGTTLVQSFNPAASSSNIMAGRSIFDVVSERQAAFNNSANRPL
ncbi:hypothetical protein BDV95DRAFT_610896 [Massariosphaeria phaeospora]|uniref:BZIP domain-containing protein n=1 Tax=Massariosphaeria phaeospora TaxID=100035 RepID=A0A7C8I0M3_9PLEO|nr:hypothetical protein BDV95DRAFT_610896 [Massariosphaeria phaeospora]